MSTFSFRLSLEWLKYYRADTLSVTFWRMVYNTSTFETAKTFGEFLRCNFRFLRGELPSTPFHAGQLDIESWHLVPDLLSLTEAGFWSVESQPTITEHQQKAYLIGFVDRYNYWLEYLTKASDKDPNFKYYIAKYDNSESASSGIIKIDGMEVNFDDMREYYIDREILKDIKSQLSFVIVTYDAYEDWRKKSLFNLLQYYSPSLE